MNAAWTSGLVRTWVRMYTAGLPMEVRQARRHEIDDDLWCQAQDAAASGRSDRSLAGEIGVRLVLGMAADVSWRFDQARIRKAGSTRERRLAMNAPGRGILAILGGLGWVVLPIPQGIVGRDWPTEGWLPWLLFVSVVGGSWALAGACAGLVGAVQDRIRPGIAIAVLLGCFVGAVSVLGAYAFIVGLPVASALLLRELARLGAVGAGLARAHIATAALTFVPIGAILTSGSLMDDPLLASSVLALVIPYAISWIVLGVGLVRPPAVVTQSAGRA
jgi:hypothetical protein